jgi:hypothetical protein
MIFTGLVEMIVRIIIYIPERIKQEFHKILHLGEAEKIKEG